jgi:pentatricopeptide repeat protein
MPPSALCVVFAICVALLLSCQQQAAYGWVQNFNLHHHHHHHHALLTTTLGRQTSTACSCATISLVVVMRSGRSHPSRLSLSSSSSSPTTTTTSNKVQHEPAQDMMMKDDKDDDADFETRNSSKDTDEGNDDQDYDVVSKETRRNNKDHHQENNSNDNANSDDDGDDDDDNTTYKMNLKLAALANEVAWLRKRGSSSGSGSNTGNSISSSHNKAATVALQAVRLLREMPHPDTVAYNSVLKALAKLSPAVLRDDTGSSSNSSSSLMGSSITSSTTATTTKTTAAQLALDLLQEMKQLHQQQVQANQAWYQAMAADTKKNNSNGSNSSDSGSRAGLTQEQISAGPPRIHVKPNVRTYSTVMDALGRIGTYDAAEQAHELLWEMSSEFGDGGDAALQPNLISYNTLLSAYAKCCNGAGSGASGAVAARKNSNDASTTSTSSTVAADAADQCVQILLEMPIQPDVISYNAVLHALAGSGHENAGERAEELLRAMISSSDKNDGIVRPNARSYSTCMNAWGQSGHHAERAHALLTEMLDLYDTGREEYRDLAPNAVSYATVIHAYAVSKNIPDKAIKAYGVFQDMMKRGIAPNLITFNTLLNTCSMSKPTPETFVMVEKIYQTILRKASSQSGNDTTNNANSEQPDHFTFGTVLKACAGNLYWRNAQFAPAVFAEACRRGQVSRGVLQQFRQAVPVDTYRRLVAMTRNYRNLKRNSNTNDSGNNDVKSMNGATATSLQQQNGGAAVVSAAADATGNSGGAIAASARRQSSNYTYLDDNLGPSSSKSAATAVARGAKNNARRRAADDYTAWTDLPYEWRRNVRNDRDRRRRR